MTKFYTRLFSKTFISAVFISAFSFGFSQTVPVAWTVNYNGPPDNTDDAVDLVIDAAQNVYVTGTSFGVSGTFDISTVKYNTNGVQQWVAIYNGTGNNNDGAAAIKVDASGNVYVVGKSQGTGTFDDVTTIKYNSSGIQQWVAFYNGTSNLQDEGTGIDIDGSGNVYVTGFSSETGNNQDIVTIKYDAAGSQQWIRFYNGTGGGNDGGMDIELDATGNVYVTGKGNENTSNMLSDIVTIKYDNSGTQQWVMAYDGGSDNDYGKALTIDKNNNVIVTGYSFLSGNWFDYATIKYNPSGVQQWATRYNYAANRYEEVQDIIADTLGNIYVTGQSQNTGNNSTPPDIATVKYNSAGVQQWVQRYNGTANLDDRGYSIDLDDTMNVFVTGYTSITTANRDYATIKYNTNGVQQWIATHNGIGGAIDQGVAVKVSATGYVYVTGLADMNPTITVNDDYVTIKYAPQSIGFADLNEKRFSLLLFPNPANAGSTISITSEFITGNSKLSFSVFDIAGKEIIGMKEMNCISGNGSYTFGKDELKGGIYMVRIYDGENNFVGTGKLVIE